MIFYECLINSNENVLNSFQLPEQHFLKQHQGQSNNMIFSNLPHVEKEYFPVQFSSTKVQHISVLQEDMQLNYYNSLYYISNEVKKQHSISHNGENFQIFSHNILICSYRSDRKDVG